jgi:RHS repeat-associated protein
VRFNLNQRFPVEYSDTLLDAFGAQIASTGTVANTYLYSGERFDSNLNLYQLRARYYNMLTGRFETMDPLQLQPRGCSTSRLDSPWDLNSYAYADDDPVDRSDPSGRDAAVEYAFDFQQVLVHVLASGTLYYLAHALIEETECGATFIKCLENPWNPPPNPDYGRRKPCLDCYFECKRQGSWPEYKCPTE